MLVSSGTGFAGSRSGVIIICLMILSTHRARLLASRHRRGRWCV